MSKRPIGAEMICVDGQHRGRWHLSSSSRSKTIVIHVVHMHTRTQILKVQRSAQPQVRLSSYAGALFR